jgi:hypothetical protein
MYLLCVFLLIYLYPLLPSSPLSATHLLLLSGVFSFGEGVQTHGLILARQVLYHLSHTSSLLIYVFLKKG